MCHFNVSIINMFCKSSCVKSEQFYSNQKCIESLLSLPVNWKLSKINLINPDSGEV